MTIWSYNGGMIQFYDTNLNDMAGQISPMRDAFGQGIKIHGRNKTGQSRDVGLNGRDILLIGNTSVNGSFNVYGQKNCIQVTENFGLRTLSAVESPDVLYYDRGVVNLQNGEATIYIDPIFLECIEPDTELTPWQIWVQCYGENDVYVSEVGADYFKVKERNGGTSNNKVIWRFEAIRKNYAGIRLMEVTN